MIALIQRVTLPVLPLSLPASIITSSSRRILDAIIVTP